VIRETLKRPWFSGNQKFEKERLGEVHTPGWSRLRWGEKMKNCKWTASRAQSEKLLPPGRNPAEGKKRDLAQRKFHRSREGGPRIGNGNGICGLENSRLRIPRIGNPAREEEATFGRTTEESESRKGG